MDIIEHIHIDVRFTLEYIGLDTWWIYNVIVLAIE